MGFLLFLLQHFLDHGQVLVLRIYFQVLFLFLPYNLIMSFSYRVFILNRLMHEDFLQSFELMNNLCSGLGLILFLEQQSDLRMGRFQLLLQPICLAFKHTVLIPELVSTLLNFHESRQVHSFFLGRRSIYHQTWSLWLVLARSRSFLLLPDEAFLPFRDRSKPCSGIPDTGIHDLLRLHPFVPGVRSVEHVFIDQELVHRRGRVRTMFLDHLSISLQSAQEAWSVALVHVEALFFLQFPLDLCVLPLEVMGWSWHMGGNVDLVKRASGAPSAHVRLGVELKAN
jgi:hypothetical protein